MSLIELNIYFFIGRTSLCGFLFKAKHPDIIMLAKCALVFGFFRDF